MVQGSVKPQESSPPGNASPGPGRLAGGTKPDVVVRVRRGIVPIHREDPGIRAVVEVAAADERAVMTRAPCLSPGSDILPSRFDPQRAAL